MEGVDQSNLDAMRSILYRLDWLTQACILFRQVVADNDAFQDSRTPEELAVSTQRTVGLMFEFIIEMSRALSAGMDTAASVPYDDYRRRLAECAPLPEPDKSFQPLFQVMAALVANPVPTPSTGPLSDEQVRCEFLVVHRQVFPLGRE